MSRTLYDKLTKTGFLIDDDIDELEIVRKYHKQAVESKNTLLVILPTLNCNYKCWYCIQDHVGERMDDHTIEKVKKAINRLINEEKITSLTIEWFGGEPFMYFHEVVQPISEYAKSKCEEAAIPFFNTATTNAYYLVDDVVKKMDSLNFRRFQITVDGNRESHDSVKYMEGLSSAFDRALEHIKGILSNIEGSTVTLRINYTHKISSDIIVDICSRIPENLRGRITILPRKVWQEQQDRNFGPIIFKMMRVFRKMGFLVESWSPLTGFVSCYANRRYYASITPTGGLAKCTACDDFYAKESPGRLSDTGELIWDKDYENAYCSPTFENKNCLNCNRLPCCMGHCPKENVRNNQSCKYSYSDFNFMDSVIEFIDGQYV